MDDERTNDQEKDSSSDQFSALFSRYTESINLSAAALRSAAEDFEGSAKDIKSLKGSLDSLSSVLGSFSKQFNDTAKDIGDGNEDNVSKLSKIFSDDVKGQEKVQTKGQIIGNAFLKSLKIVADYAIKKLTAAFEDNVSVYESHFTSITAKMQYSAREYTSQLTSTVDRLKDENLNHQFTQGKYLDALEAVLETGMRGDDAEEIAYHNMITSKLLPSINTNSKTYLKVSKILGEDFNKAVGAIGTYTQQVYGAEGIDEGQAEILLEQIHKELLLAANGDEKLATEQFAEIYNEYNKAANMYGEEFANHVLDKFKAVRNADMSDLIAVQAIESIGGEIGDTSAAIKDFGGFIDSIANLYRGESDQTRGLLGNSAGYGGYDTAMSDYVKIFDLYGSQVTGDLSKKKDNENFTMSDINSMWDDQVGKLEDGYYASRTEKQENWNSNLTAALADYGAQWIPDVVGAIGTIFKLLTTFFVAWKAINALKSLSDGGGVVGDAVNAASKLGKGGGTVGKLLGKVSSFGGASSLGGGLLNLAAGPGALVAGGAMMLKDGISVGKENGSVGAGLLASVTGDSNIGLTESQKHDKAAKTVKEGWVDSKFGIDWKKVGVNALKGTAVGAGVGTALGGWAAGTGTAVGAAVGAVGGAVASIIDQAIESAKYNKLAKVVENYSKAVEESTKAQEQYDAVVKEISSTEEILQGLKDGSIEGEEARNAALLQLQEQYPTILGDISNESQLTKEKIALIEQQLKLEKMSAIDDLNTANDGIASKAKDAVQATLDMGATQHDLDLLSKIEDEDHNGDMTSTLKETAKSAGYDSVEDYVNHINKLSNHGDIFVENDGGWYVAGSKDSDYATIGDNIKDWKSDFMTEDGKVSEENVKKAQETIDQMITDLNQYYKPILEAYSQFKDEEGKVNLTTEEGWTQTQIDAMNDNFGGISSMIGSINKIAKSYDQSGYVSNLMNSRYGNMEEVYKAFGKTVPSFKIGLPRVPFDNFPAMLHQDEMVLTSADSGKLRQLSSHGVSGFLSDLMSFVTGASKSVATAVPQETEITYEPVIKAISEQTEVLSNYLSKILDFLTHKSNGSGNTTMISTELKTFVSY